jgi:predicted nucleic acid-binding protein
MNKILTHILDTSVYCQPIKKLPLKSVMERWKTLGDEPLCLPIFCETEILQGLEMKNSEKLWRAYEEILKDRLPILPFDINVARQYAKLQANCTKRGRPGAIFDLFIASTARVHNLIVATCNYRDFKDIPGIQVEDWSS